MKFIGNILWLILGGLLVSLGYFIAGLLYCVTIIGIPFGYQLWKFGVFSLWPFGTDVVDGNNAGGLPQHIHECDLDCAGMVGDRCDAPCLRAHLLHGDCWDPVRASAFQDGAAFRHAVRQDIPESVIRR